MIKWYDGTDLSYLLSPNTSFDNGMGLSMSSGLLRIVEELKDNKTSAQKNGKRNEVFKRLKKKFSILLPPPKTTVRKINRGISYNYIFILLKIFD